jgi:hypothetical protein
MNQNIFLIDYKPFSHSKLRNSIIPINSYEKKYFIIYNRYQTITQEVFRFYQTDKGQANHVVYQIIFLAFSFLFFILSFILNAKTINWTCSFYFDKCQQIKTFAYLYCLTLSILSLGISYLVRPKMDIFYFAKNFAYLIYRSLFPYLHSFKAKIKILKSTDISVYQLTLAKSPSLSHEAFSSI